MFELLRTIDESSSNLTDRWASLLVTLPSSCAKLQENAHTVQKAFSRVFHATHVRNQFHPANIEIDYVRQRSRSLLLHSDIIRFSGERRGVELRRRYSRLSISSLPNQLAQRANVDVTDHTVNSVAGICGRERKKSKRHWLDLSVWLTNRHIADRGVQGHAQ